MGHASRSSPAASPRACATRSNRCWACRWPPSAFTSRTCASAASTDSRMASPLPAVDAPVRLRLLERYRHLDGQILRLLTWAALNWLRTNQQVVNALNVFPIPDGDTGTNMVLTMQAGWNEVAATAENSVSAVAHALAQGALMGARGNSGVILSQLWRGFARSVDKMSTVDAQGVVQALAEARDTAYRGVVRPVEGTILTE